MDLDFKTKLMHYNEELHDDDFKILKFLCEPVIKNSAVSSPTDVFDALERCKLLSKYETGVLVEAFVLMQRIDLVDHIMPDGAMVHVTPETVSFMNTKKICPFRAVLVQISDGLSKEELTSLK